jgi:hypothetical protein
MENENKDLTVLEQNPYQQAIIDPHNARSIQEVQGAIIVAQRCPRDEFKAMMEIEKACKHKTLAEKALYAYPRGGEMVTGPSIRLAEVLARCWGNMQYGVREVSNNDRETKFIAYSWDMEKNVRSEREFTQKHVRWTKKAGIKQLEDPRDQYEVVASSAARRMRACILQILPGYVIEDAIKECEETLKAGGGIPLEARIKNMLSTFNEIGVTKEMIEKRLMHKVDAINETELVGLRKIYSSIKDGMSTRESWFEVIDEQKAKLNEKFGKKEKKEEKQEETVNENYESI